MTTPLPAELPAALVAQIEALNTPGHPSLYAVQGDVVTGWWDFANPKLAQALFDGGASSAFRYLVTLDPASKTYRCWEKDSGYNNGRFRAYSGYNRGVNVNLLTIIASLAQRSERKKRTGSATPTHEYTPEELKIPLRAVLDANGWKRKGLIR